MTSYLIAILISFFSVVLVISAARFFRKERSVKDANYGAKPSKNKAYYYLAENRPSEALKEFKRLTLKGDVSPETYIIMSALHRIQGDTDKAAHLCEEALLWQNEKDDTIAAALRELAKIYAIAGKTYNAQNNLQKLPKRFHNHPTVTFIRAEICREKGDFEAAIRHYSEYEKRTGKKCGGIITDAYIRSLQNVKDNSHKIKTLNFAVKSYPANANVRFALAKALFEEGKTVQGLNETKSVITNDLIKTKADLLEIENIFYKYGSMDELFHIMSSKIASQSTNPVPYLFISSYYGKMNDTVRAKEILEEYLTRFQPKAIITKAYFKLVKGCAFPVGLLRFNDVYQCGVCKMKFSNYATVCLRCASADSLDYF